MVDDENLPRNPEDFPYLEDITLDIYECEDIIERYHSVTNEEETNY